MPTWKDFVADVQGWADGKMKPYMDRTAKRRTTKQFSIINDNVWGSIRLSSLERAIVDSPILQRLRRIRQLGAATLVYPSAEHTRFEHCLGALHRASVILDAILAAAEARPETSLLTHHDDIRRWQDAVRIGALLHDSGHVFFSHAGERAITESGIPGYTPSEIDAILQGAARELDCEDRVAFSELVSYAIITSTSLKDLCQRFDQSIANQLETIAAALVHSRAKVPAKDRWVGDILSGPLDVDKQDYIARDALMAGVGMQIEPHRSAEVIRVCDVGKARVANERGVTFDQDERRAVVTFAGITAVEDMLLSRMSMSLRVYKHHKVRLAERIIERAYGQAMRAGLIDLFLGDGQADSASAIRRLLDLTDGAFLTGEIRRRLASVMKNASERAERLSETATQQDREEGRKTGEEVRQLRQRTRDIKVLVGHLELIEDRNLPIRAFAYGSGFAAADGEGDVSAMDRAHARLPWSAVVEAMIDSTQLRDVERDIVTVTQELVKIFEGEPDQDLAIQLEASVYADLGSIKPVKSSSVYVYSLSNETELLSYDKLFQPSQWLDALQTSKLICYVHAPRRYAEYVSIAAEMVFANRFHAASRNIRNVYSRCGRNDINALKEVLIEKFEKQILAKDEPPIPGLWYAITPPSFISAKQTKGVLFVRWRAFGKRQEFLQKNALAVSAFYETFNKSDSENIAVMVDIVGSSKLVEELKKQDVEESDARATMLIELQAFVIDQLRDSNFGSIPIKTEGDAVICLSSVANGHRDSFVKRVRDLVFGEAWQMRFKQAMKDAGWKGSAPSVRVVASVGVVTWQEELHDLGGGATTALFVLEAQIKELMKGKPAAAFLGTWAEPIDGAASILEHTKTGKVKVLLLAEPLVPAPGPSVPSTQVPPN